MSATVRPTAKSRMWSSISRQISDAAHPTLRAQTFFLPQTQGAMSIPSPDASMMSKSVI